MSLSLSNFLEEQILTHLLRTGSWTKPTVFAVGLLQTIPSNDSGTGLAELTKTGYARVDRPPLDANWSDPSVGTQGESDNVAIIDFGALTGATERAIGVAVWDATTAGNLLLWGALATGWKPADVNDTGDVFTAQSHGFVNTDRVFLRNIVGATGVDQQTEYFIVGATTDTFQVSLASGGAAVTITADGSCEVGASQARDIADGDEINFPAGDLNISLD